MTIAAWIVTTIFALGAIAIGIFVTYDADYIRSKVIAWIAVAVFLFVMYGGLFWYFNNTAAGVRALTDQKSNLQNGLNRTINVYTANGEIIATYSGKIDLEADTSYVKFDWEGHRYIYYNCFVETIAEIP